MSSVVVVSSANSVSSDIMGSSGSQLWGRVIVWARGRVGGAYEHRGVLAHERVSAWARGRVGA
jgi:hypothetical protein